MCAGVAATQPYYFLTLVKNSIGVGNALRSYSSVKSDAADDQGCYADRLRNLNCTDVISPFRVISCMTSSGLYLEPS